jgi:predicted nuclease of predicted toxin-antitoxin system
MRFLLDMNVSPRVANWLRENGHDVVHLNDEGLGALDERGAIIIVDDSRIRIRHISYED